MGPSGIMKLVLREEYLFSTVSSQRPLGHLSEIYGIFSNRDLPSTSKEWPSKVVIACNVLAVSWTNFKNSKEKFSYLMLAVLLDGFWLLGTFSAQRVSVHLTIYGYLHTQLNTWKENQKREALILTNIWGCSVSRWNSWQQKREAPTVKKIGKNECFHFPFSFTFNAKPLPLGVVLPTFGMCLLTYTILI